MVKIFFKENSKFKNDSVKFENEQIIFKSYGVILNLNSLLAENNTNNKEELFHSLYIRYAEKFIEKLKGSFVVCLYDKPTKKWLFFTNHIGDKRVYYSIALDEVIVSDSLMKIILYHKEHNLNYNLNLNAAYELLTYGHFLGDNTLIKECKRLLPGSYLRVDKKEITSHFYYKLQNEDTTTLKEKDIIEEVDRLFKNAVKLQFEKDREYGYSHLVALSGGLDSRMTAWIAKELGFDDITNYTFSQFGYLDMKVAREITHFLNTKWIFIALDKGNFLKELQKTVEITEGNNSFLHHTFYAHSLLPLQNYGIQHSGSLGDVILGSYEKNNYHTKPEHLHMKSLKMKDKLNDNYFMDYPNQELFTFYNRGLNGILASHLINQNVSETFSPFLDKDFLSFCFSLPLKYRVRQSLYIKWIIRNYPKAAEFKWEKIKGYITEPSVTIRNKNVIIRKIPSFIFQNVFKRIGITSLTGINSRNHMNPFQYWYRSNPTIAEFYDKCFNEQKDILTDKELKDDVIYLFREGNIFEKMMVLNLLVSVKYFFEV